jgi:hypothetical protein
VSNRFLSRSGSSGGGQRSPALRFLERASALGAGGGRSVNQILSDELTVDATTTAVDPVFATLLSVPITTIGGDLLILFTIALGASNTANGEMRALLDGVRVRATSCVLLAPPFSNAAALSLHVTGVAPGAHLVTADWGKAPGTGAAVTLICSPVTLPNRHHASLVVAEIT